MQKIFDKTHKMTMKLLCKGIDLRVIEMYLLLHCPSLWHVWFVVYSVYCIELKECKIPYNLVVGGGGMVVTLLGY